MARITDLATWDGKAGHWSAYTLEIEDGVNNVRRHYIKHYQTVMLAYDVEIDEERSTDRVTYYKWDGIYDTVSGSTGHGSVSDQQGMNRLFQTLGMKFYFVRAEKDFGIWSTDPEVVVFPMARWLEDRKAS